MAEVRLEDVTKRFGEFSIERLNLTVEDKEFVVLVGPSGCGKSTTLRMIAGLEEPSEGKIYIGSRIVNHVPPKDRDIAMVFQNYALYPHMSVYENMAFGLKLRKLPKGDIDVRVQEAAKILGIEGFLHRKPKELSGGQRQRVAMGRCIVRMPQAFLFDEPLSNLDAKLRVQMREELAKLHERLEGTIVYVTHDQVEAMTLAQRIVIMNQGEVMQVGAPMEVYHNPKNVFVAGFIGSPAMNFLEARIAIESDKIFVLVNDYRLAVPEDLGERFGAAVGCEVILGVRPEHIYDVNIKEPFPGGAKIRANVEVVEPLGSQVIVISRFGSNHLTACLDPKTKAKSRDELEFLIDLNLMHLFDKATGKAF
jgi:multiple sugar transport system ATP-binding protein